jgi:hypothetical protein
MNDLLIRGATVHDGRDCAPLARGPGSVLRQSGARPRA